MHGVHLRDTFYRVRLQDNYLAEALKMRNLVSEFTPAASRGALPPPDASADVRLSIDPTAAERAAAPLVGRESVPFDSCLLGELVAARRSRCRRAGGETHGILSPIVPHYLSVITDKRGCSN